MNTARQVGLWIIGAAPIVALLLSMLSGIVPSHVWRSAVRVVVMSALTSAMLLILDDRAERSLAEPTWEWLNLPGLNLSWGWHGDGLSLVQSLVTSLVVLIILRHWPDQIPWRVLMLAWVGVSLANLANDLGQLIIGWMLSSWISSEMVVRRREVPHRPVWLVQRVSDSAMLLSVALIWNHFEGSLAFSQWTPASLATLRGEMIETIALGILIGVLGRTAQLPFTVWLNSEPGFAARAGQSMTTLSHQMIGLWNVPDGHHVAERLQADPRNRWHESSDPIVPSPVLAWWLSAAFLPMGIGLLWRFAPWFAAAEHTRLLCVVAGAFTVLLTSASAVAQNTWPSVLAQLAAGHSGLVLIAFGQSPNNGVSIGAFALVSNSLLFALLLDLPTNSAGYHRLSVAPALALASGLWGRQAILNLVWQSAWPASVAPSNEDASSMVLGATVDRIWPLIALLLCLSELLTSLAVGRAWFLKQRLLNSNTSHKRRPTVSAADIAWGMLILAMGAWLIWLGTSGSPRWKSLFESTLSSSYSSTEDVASQEPFAAGILFPITAIGAVLSILMYARPSQLPARFARWLGPFTRLSRNQFYFDDLFFLVIVQPMVQFCRGLVWFETRLRNPGLASLRRVLTSFIHRTLEPLIEMEKGIGMLMTLGSVIVLTWMLVWLRSSP